MLDDSGVVRSDITTSIGSSEKVAGVPMTINLTVTDSASGYAAMAGAAVYVWHCDATGNYSMYSQGATDQTWLRGVTETNANGTATFTSVFPGCYAGRWPHIHFEVYKSTSDATSSGQIVKTSQIALPQAICETVYQNTSTYPNSTRNLGQLSLKTDNVFGNDGDPPARHGHRRRLERVCRQPDDRRLTEDRFRCGTGIFDRSNP